MRNTVPIGSTRGSAATVPTRVRSPERVLPEWQYAVAARRIVFTRRGVRRVASAVVGLMTSARQEAITQIFTTTSPSIRVPRRTLRAAEPAEEQNNQHRGDEGSPPGIQAEGAQ